MHTKQEDNKRHKLPEEHTFDQGVYGGISYAAQAGTGIALSYWLKEGSGKAIFQKIGEWMAPRFYPKLLAEEGMAIASKKGSANIIITTMVLVGTSFLIPVKMLEKKKAKIVRNMHEKAHRNEDRSPEEIAFDEKCLQQLEKEPLQSWGSLIEGRIASLAGVYALSFGLDSTKYGNDFLQEKTTQALLHWVEKIGLKEAAHNPTFKKILNIGFLDVFYSMVSAGGLYAYSHYVHPPKKGPVSEPNSHPQASEEVVSAPATQALPGGPSQQESSVLFADNATTNKTKNNFAKAANSSYAQKLAAEADTAGLAPAR